MLFAVALAVALASFQTNGGTGASLPGTCSKGSMFIVTTDPVTPFVCGESNTWSAIGGGGAVLPVGVIVPIVSGACPVGFAEETTLNGKTLVGTLTANGNIGTTGGADTITPTMADHASHTHTYTDVPAHTHTQASQTATTGGVSSWEHGAIDTSSTAAETLTTGSTGVAQGTTAGPSATLTHTGTPFDNRSAFARVIFCKKT